MSENIKNRHCLIKWLPLLCLFYALLWVGIGMGVGRGGGGEDKIYEFQIQIFKFSDFQIVDFRFLFFLKIFSENMLVRYRRINNKGVLERPGTKWKVLGAISSTLKFQYFRKVDFLMPCKTKSRENLCLRLRMVRAVTLDTPRPLQFQPELPKNHFLCNTLFFQVH